MQNIRRVVSRRDNIASPCGCYERINVPTWTCFSTA